LSYHSSNPIIFKNPSFEKLKSNIFRIELMTNIKNGNRKYALKNIFMVSGFENKIKVLVAIILPARVLKFISDRFY
jgi:aspartate aminotransferase-like enzyme